MLRREALLSLASTALLAACGGGAAELKRPAPAAPPKPLHLAPAADLVASASLAWLFEARPRDVFATPELIPAIRLIVPDKSFEAFAARNGGVDLRQLHELTFGTYPQATILVARGLFDPARVEKAFADRAEPLDGRAIDHANAEDGSPLAAITRLWGSVHGSREQLALFGRDAIALERGRFGPLKAAEAFAQRRLKKARPALKAQPLARLAELLGDAPLRGFAPGPFEGEWQSGFGGLLRASSAFGISARTAPQPGRARLDFKLVLLGGWAGETGPLAVERLRAWFSRLDEHPLGVLCGADRPIEGPTVRSTDDALTLDVALDALTLARGVRSATTASVDEIMSY